MNVWQGSSRRTTRSPTATTAPAQSTALRPTATASATRPGNVWEWTADWFDPAYRARDRSRDPNEPPAGTHRVKKAVRIGATPPIAGATGWPLGRRTRPMPPPGISVFGVRASRPRPANRRPCAPPTGKRAS